MAYKGHIMTLCFIICEIFDKVIPKVYLFQTKHQGELTNFTCNKITWYSLCTRHHCWQLLQSLQEYHEVAINHFLFVRWGNLCVERLKNCHRTLWQSWQLNSKHEDLECAHNMPWRLKTDLNLHFSILFRLCFLTF